jgi:AAA ATPase domain
MVTEGPAEVLHDRRDERETLERLLAAVRGGQSRVLVVCGEPGVGKTALLDFAINSASGFRVARAVGVESEMELAFAALQQLCAPMLDRLDRLPAPQRDALGVAFGLRAGNAPDRFLVGLAVLSLLAEAAEEQPLLCVVDDAQWLDRVSAQALVFVARRLLAESVALVFATREASESSTGCRSWPSRVSAMAMRAPFWARRCTCRWTRRSASGWSRRRAATRWRCWSCREA